MASPTYKTLDAAVEYLRGAGWKRSKSMLAKDTTDGKIARTADGAYTQYALDQYGKAHCKRLVGVVRRDERIDKLTERKLSAETELAETKARLAHREEQIRNRELLPAAEVFGLLAGIFAQLRADWENAIYAKVAESILLCRGDDEFVPDVTDFWLTEKATCLNRFYRAWRDQQPLLVPRSAITEAMRDLEKDEGVAA